MKKILHIDSSAKPQGSATRALTAYAVASFQRAYPDAVVVYHDLTAQALPHINGQYLSQIFSATPDTTVPSVALSDALVQEIFEADVLIIGAPMYNFGIASQLKAWFDHVIRAGKTFRYTETGPKGLVSGKKAIVVTASGGIYETGAMAAYDHVGPHVQQMLAFIGIDDTTTVRAEGQKLSPDALVQTTRAAETKIDATIGSYAELAASA